MRFIGYQGRYMQLQTSRLASSSVRSKVKYDLASLHLRRLFCLAGHVLDPCSIALCANLRYFLSHCNRFLIRHPLSDLYIVNKVAYFLNDASILYLKGSWRLRSRPNFKSVNGPGERPADLTLINTSLGCGYTSHPPSVIIARPIC
jgi:hypothetical protein